MASKSTESWWRRLGTPESGFRYVKVDGKPLTSEAGRRRIAELAIPPRWTNVHIAPDGQRKIQAFGTDQADRKQYIYSPHHVKRRDAAKWSNVLSYARVLPVLRAQTHRDLRRRKLDRQKVAATIVALISRAFFRAGSEKYLARYNTFGITTLDKRHVKVHGRNLEFRYRGKKSVDQWQYVGETPLVEIMKELLELPGDRLFRFEDDLGELHNFTAQDLNAYLQEILGDDYSAKDLRTWGGTVRAAMFLDDLGPADTKTEAKRNVLLCCRSVAWDMGNTAAICRKSYIHPAVLKEYEMRDRTIEPFKRKTPRGRDLVTYYPEEAALMRFLERYG